MTDTRVLEIIKRKSSIPNDGESFDEILQAYDRAIEIIEQHIQADSPKTGFYLKPDPEEALNKTPVDNNPEEFTPAGLYLHGMCDCFAVALHDIFKYPIMYLVDSENRPTLDSMVHVYCEQDDRFIDVRGITDEITECFSAFEDFFTQPITLSITRKDLMASMRKHMGKDTAEKYIKMAKQFITNNKAIYELK